MRWLAGGLLVACGIALATACSEDPADGGAGGGPDDDAGTTPEAGTEAGGDGALPPDRGCSADLATDPKSCGSCGHDCLGGPCSKGRCGPVLVAADQINPDNLVSDGKYLFWFSMPHLQRTLVTGGPIESLGSVPSGIKSLVVDETSVYTLTFNCLGPSGGVEILRWPKAAPPGTAATVFSLAVPCTDFSGSLVSAGGELFFGSRDSGNTYRIVRAPKDGGPPSYVSQSVPSGTLWSVAATPSTIDVCDSDRLWTLATDAGSVPLDASPEAGAAPKVIATSGTCIALAVEGRDAYYVDPWRGSIKHATHDESDAAASVFAGNQGRPRAVVADTLNVYWATQSDYRIWTCPRSGCSPSPRLVLAGYGGPTHLAHDDKALYFGTIAGGVWKVAK